jgi:hypothetical protein
VREGVPTFDVSGVEHSGFITGVSQLCYLF